MQRLSTGEPYILSGPGISVVTNSIGQIEISGSASTSAGSLISPTFEVGQGWTIVPTNSPADGDAAFVVVGGVPAARLSLSSAGALHGLSGPRIERPFPQGVEMWKATVRIGSQTAPIFLGIYVRNASSNVGIFSLTNGSCAGWDGTWSIDGPGPAGEITFDSTCFFCLRGSRSSGHRRGSINSSGSWAPRSTRGYFEPTHIGIIALSDGPWTGVADVDQFTLETFG